MSIAYQYCSLDQAKRMIGTTNDKDDALISDLISEATAYFEDATKRHFYELSQARKYHALRDVYDRRTLILDEDLLSVTSITLGDGTIVKPTYYELEPYNSLPKALIVLHRNAGVIWRQYTTPEASITVTGLWGYNTGTIPPEDVQYAVAKLASWYYRRRKAAPDGQTGAAEQGKPAVPQTMPDEVVSAVKRYQVVKRGGWG